MKFAQVQDTICVNVVEADEDFARVSGLIELPDGYGIGDFYDGAWHHEKPKAEASADVLLTAITRLETLIQQLQGSGQ